MDGLRSIGKFTYPSHRCNLHKIKTIKSRPHKWPTWQYKCCSHLEQYGWPTLIASSRMSFSFSSQILKRLLLFYIHKSKLQAANDRGRVFVGVLFSLHIYIYLSFASFSWLLLHWFPLVCELRQKKMIQSLMGFYLFFSFPSSG